MCVAVAIKYNEWKVLEARSKFWCVVILNTLWQHTACQGCKTSSNRLLNIRPLHPYSPWLPYIKPGLQHAKAKCVRDYMASRKIEQHYIFIRGEWLCVCVCACKHACVKLMAYRLHIYKCLCVTGGGTVRSIIQLKLCVTVTWDPMTDGWTKSSQVWGFRDHSSLVTFKVTISRPWSRQMRPAENFSRTSSTSHGSGLCEWRCPQSPHCWEAQGI